MIFRNDDISHETDVRQFASVQALFDKYNTPQTIAVICNNIWKNKRLIEFINKNNIIVQVHCWEHYDLTTNLDITGPDLDKCIDTIKKYFGTKPVLLYPPWNKSSKELEQLALSKGLIVSNKKISLSQYLSGKQGEVVNFHSWCIDECLDLERALIKYTI